MWTRIAMLGPDDPRHGTENGYKNLKCRCAACKKAWAAAFQTAQRRRQFTLAVDDPRHGRASTYGNYKCRCTPCTDAWAEAKRQQRFRIGDNLAVTQSKDPA